jgi:prophage regulatory protein
MSPRHPQCRILRFLELKPLKSIPFSRQYVATLVADGRFPKPVYLGEQTKGWLETELDDWLAARIAERDGADA